MSPARTRLIADSGGRHVREYKCREDNLELNKEKSDSNISHVCRLVKCWLKADKVRFYKRYGKKVEKQKMKNTPVSDTYIVLRFQLTAIVKITKPLFLSVFLHAL